MKLFIYEYVDGVTSYYHSGGAVLIAAKDKRAARKLWVEHIAGRSQDSGAALNDLSEETLVRCCRWLMTLIRLCRCLRIRGAAE